MIDFNLLKYFVCLLMLGLSLLLNAEGIVMTNVTYIEASTGNRWKVDQWPERVKQSNVNVNFLALYQFDKSPALQQTFLDADKPDIIVLQECSVYFPGNYSEYQKLFLGWIDEVEQQGIQLVIATIVPPTKSQGYFQDFKNFIKHRILGRPTQIEQVMAFNDWLHQTASSRNIPVLDLESLVRLSGENRHMNNAYNSGDGIHPNAYAYSLFDQQLSVILNDLISAN